MKLLGNDFVFIALCDDGWTFHDSKCYFVGRTANRTRAEHICQNKNATLVAIRSQAQIYFMKTLEITSNTWIGLTDDAREGNWQWNNGDIATITDWGLNQPDGGVLENCALLNISDIYRWHDHPCSSLNDYVCERGKATFTFLINWFNCLYLRLIVYASQFLQIFCLTIYIFFQVQKKIKSDLLLVHFQDTRSGKINLII